MKYVLLPCLISTLLSASAWGSIKDDALWILWKAAENSSPSNAKVYREIFDKLNYAIVEWPSHGMTWERCDDYMLAYVYVSSRSDTIWMCSDARGLSKLGKAQVMIHEAVHLTGRWDECVATAWEHDAMKKAGFSSQYRSAYNCR